MNEVKGFSRISPDMLPINKECYSAISQFCQTALGEGHLNVLGGIQQFIRQNYDTLVAQWSRVEVDSPVTIFDVWRYEMVGICRNLMKHINHQFGNQFIAVYPWFGALAFLPACCEQGINQHCHLPFLAKNEYFNIDRAIKIDFDSEFFENKGVNESVLIVDSALATGRTVKAIIKILLEKEVFEHEIVVVNVVSSPEGVYNLLNEFPQIKIYTAALDTCLDGKGNIVPGIGNVEERFLKQFDIDFFKEYRRAFTFYQWALLQDCIKQANPVPDIVA